MGVNFDYYLENKQLRDLYMDNMRNIFTATKDKVKYKMVMNHRPMFCLRDNRE